MVLAFWGVSLWLRRDLLAATWQTFVGALLFYKARYFVIPFQASFAAAQGLVANTPFVYYLAFADFLLLILCYLLIRWRFVLRKRASQKLPFKEATLLFGLLVLGAVTSFTSQFAGVSWFGFWRVLFYFLSFLVASEVLRDKKTLTTTINNLLLFVGFNSLLIVLQKLHGGPLGLLIEDFSTAAFGRFADESVSLYRPGGIYFEPNLSASLINLLLPIVFLKTLFTSKNFWRNGLLLFLMALALLFTASRANWIMAVLMTGAGYWLASHRLRLAVNSQQQRLLSWGGGILLVLQLPLVLVRLATLEPALTSSSGGLAFRLAQLKLAVSFMKQRLLGIGVDAFQYQILTDLHPAAYFYHFTAPHNIFLELGTSLGVLGLIILLVFLLKIFTRIKTLLMNSSLAKDQRLLVLGLSLGFASYWLSGLFYPWLFAPPLAELSWIILGMIYSRSQR